MPIGCGYRKSDDAAEAERTTRKRLALAQELAGRLESTPMLAKGITLMAESEFVEIAALAYRLLNHTAAGWAKWRADMK